MDGFPTARPNGLSWEWTVSFKPTVNVLIAESGRRGRGAEISQVILLQDFFSGER